MWVEGIFVGVYSFPCTLHSHNIKLTHSYGLRKYLVKRQMLNIYNLLEMFLQNKWQSVVLLLTLYNAILRIARNFLETRENIKISTNPFYHINLGLFSWEWSKKKLFFFEKKNSKWPTQKKLIFQNRQFSKFFRENFSDWSLG